MKSITHTILAALTGGVLTIGSATATAPNGLPPITGAAIALRAQPGTADDGIARQLLAQELARSRQGGETPLVLVASARLSATQEGDVLFVQLQSSRDCGSAGCSTVSFQRSKAGWVKILDTVAGTLRVAETRHLGMSDLLIRERERLIWNGAEYTATS